MKTSDAKNTSSKNAIVCIEMVEMRPEEKGTDKPLNIVYSTHPTPFGNLLIASTVIGICYVSFLDTENSALSILEDEFNLITLRSENKALHQSVADIFQHRPPRIPTLKLHVSGSKFQINVWKALIELPIGRTVTYKDIALKIGQPKACRAVGNAIARNKIAFLIPCHRVTQANGSIGNYRWGKNRKMKLISWEKKLFTQKETD